MSGRKKVEFRKQTFGRPVRHVLVYASSPVRQVIGYFEIGFIEKASPGALWRKFQHTGCIERSRFAEYYAGKAAGFAIGVKKACRFRRPLPLNAVTKSPPPQSYAYVPLACFNTLLSSAQ